MVESSAFDRKFSLIISGTSLVIHVSLFFQPTELYFHTIIGCEGSGKLFLKSKLERLAPSDRNLSLLQIHRILFSYAFTSIG